MKKLFLPIICTFLSLQIAAQNPYRSPMDIPLVLSANFGELRANHFHTGIDIKTQGVVNKPVYSIDDGYVSRISVSPSGYGLALYVTHPATGQTSVYGHLNKFTKAVAAYVKEKQYEEESFRVNLFLSPEQFPVKKGDLIAYSGNTGSSGGPHVHFEIRDSQTENALDPLPYYTKDIDDTTAPIVKGIAVYPIEGEGLLNGSYETFRQTITPLKQGGYSPISKKLNAWGRIGFGIHANDRMNGTGNIYGVKCVRLYCDSVLISSLDVAEVDFNKSRMINSLTDFDFWYRNKKFYMKSFTEPGNRLDIYKDVEDDGYLTINEERDYKLRYELEDLYGNKTSYSFTVTGKEQSIPYDKRCSQYMAWNQNNHYITDDFSLSIPAGKLYDDICFILSRESGVKADSSFHLSDCYKVHDKYIPLQSPAEIKIKMTGEMFNPHYRPYGIIQIDGKRPVWIGGEYKDGYLSAKISELGHTYAITADIKAPVITPVNPKNWKANKKIVIKVTDNLSGVASYRGTLNGDYALFGRDIKSTNYTYTFDPDRLVKGTTYQLIFTASDAAGNTSEYTYEFVY
ncbi:M23 family metallopeptidase [Dysgonomonas sp. 25]|uniref:M23 family metallopeptidase n=1 Tax=Dysgonomonas sp. 25 TaxID=2302933 RepID=UPI0013D1C429|nr:M23 family metallopeptidase [Dysgonomonas sp. 25]NDV68398.1 M23 family peptidase [Dysgonomonas sp. 25]